MKIVYVDMDSVLVDFEHGIDQLSEETYQEYKGDLDEVPGFFRDLPPIDGAIEAFHKLSERYDVYILSTAPWSNPSAWIDKLLWVKKHLPDVARKRLILSHNKHLNKGDYLIDDRTANGAGDFEGEHIHFGEEPFRDWDAVLEYLLP
ncbi:5' nucleotidase, NT5C type [Fodinibius sp. N2]|uniref:5' nucleotidase, NT5C type n=1 Tax=Fodinibius alkaliphilus TaxID=3140241 RepID=UPI00315A913B